MSRIRNNIEKLIKIIIYFGIFEALSCVLFKIIMAIKSRMHYYKFIENLKYPVCFRFNTSDDDVYRQIFIQQEYSCLNNVKDVKLIIDLGAYTGLSSIWFLNKYSNASIIAVEPYRGNFSICRKNLKPYGRRVKLVNAAIWSCKVGLTISKEKYGDTREWSKQVKEDADKERPYIKGIDIDSLISESGFEKVDILKIDIERSEIELFSHNYTKWLNKVRNIVIELHDEECQEVFFKALSGYGYVLSKSGELTCCQNISPKALM